ncbi:MAG: NrfD/PsrC family molybdoenzyme membrane anchor subunit [Desulfobacteraceae bacterium]|jgi:molybdopterin-containing oxidoreductase family membrane subunit|nr:NrfD/PsrC family molybdoenzyme membrane anchor subunit [Desulfobacteraceae bacterium]
MKAIKFQLWCGLLGLGILLGLLTTYKVFTTGFILYAKTDILVWTMPIAAYVFFSLTSTGLAFVSSIPVVFGIRRYRDLEKRTAFLEIAVLMAAFACLLLHLGSPWNAVYYLFSPNFASPLWWLGMLYGLYLVVLLLSFRKIHKGGASRGLGIFTFIVAIATSTVLGWLFGLPDARQMFGANFLAMYFPLTGFASALAAVLLFSLAYHHFTQTPLSEGDRNLYDDLSKLFGVVMALTLVFFLWRTIVGGVSATAVEFGGFRHMLGSGWYHLALWVGLIIPLVLVAVPSVRQASWGKVTSSALFLVGMFAGRLEMVLSGLVMPTGPKAEGQPSFVSYWPTMWEVFVFVFALSVLLLVYTIGERHLKLSETPE